MRTRKEKPRNAPDSPGLAERLAWFVLDVETGAVVGKLTKVRPTVPGSAEHWQAYALTGAPFEGAPEPPVRLGQWEFCRNAQNEIEQWHDERERTGREAALAVIRRER